MMRTAVISFTENGYRLAQKIAEILREKGDPVTVSVKCAGLEASITCSAAAWTKEQFARQDAVIFVGAAGIAVRSSAPHLRSKAEDPAVLVVDEAGRYCIPVLSGHLGGANALALFLAEKLQAIPVITTATDIRGKWAVDLFASENKLHIRNMRRAKEVSANILHGRPVVLSLEKEGGATGEIPDGLTVLETDASGGRQADIVVGIHGDREDTDRLYLIPKVVTLGIGCRRGVSEEQIETAVRKVLLQENIFRESLECVASIDRKADEEGLLSFCDKYRLPFYTYSAEQLRKTEGDFSTSAFVEKTTGVDNVCERSAVQAGAELLVKKQCLGGVTISLAVRKWSVRF